MRYLKTRLHASGGNSGEDRKNRLTQALGSTQVEVTLYRGMEVDKYYTRLHASGGNSMDIIAKRIVRRLGSTQVEVTPETCDS